MLRVLVVYVLYFLGSCFGLPCAYQFEESNSSFSKLCVNLPEDAPSRHVDFASKNATDKYRSRSLKDLAVLVILDDLHRGYYVDVGANHWDVDSNSFVMDYHNMWQGICIETNPNFVVGLLSHRRCLVVVSPMGKVGTNSLNRFVCNDATVRLEGDKIVKVGNALVVERNVTRCPLTTVLNFANAPKVMHYLSLPDDGTDLLALQTLDHKRYTFLLVSVERPKHRMHYMLSKHDYRFWVQLSPAGDCLYVHRSFPNLAEVVRRHRHAWDTIPEWQGAKRPYMMHPLWNKSLPAEEISTPQ